ncbi:MAG: dephospho-CoA kinase [Burkholderiales bacterium]
MVYCIGLTGGIGSGKSSAAEIFRELGAAVVDTDEIARELTGPGGAAIAAIRSQFGPDYIAADGGLDRPKMRKLVFDAPAARKRLEAILHPMIRREAQSRIAAAWQPYVLVAVPLLLETGAYRDLVSRILVVDCTEELQVTRTMQRSRLTADEVRAIMAAQLPRNARLALADDVLHNDGSMEALRRQVEALHAKYLELSRQLRGRQPDTTSAKP